MKNKVLVILLLCVVAYVALSPGMMKIVTHVFANASKASQSLTNSLASQPIHGKYDNNYTVTGKPTINVASINLALQLAHSPAVGTGQVMYDLGVQYGIDPIYALAFFKHESSFGTAGMARSTLSLGNIRCSQGYSCIGGYRAYASWQAGYQDWYRLISTLYVKSLHLLTVAQIIPVYAPSGDNNNPTQYVVSVEQSVDMWRAK